MQRVKTFDATGIAPNGILYSGDLNAVQDAAAALIDYTQSIALASISIGESGLQLLRFGSGEARLSGALRSDGIFRGLGGIYAGAFTTTQRGAIASGFRPYGLVITNSTTNQLEWNTNTDASPTWYSIANDGTGYVNAGVGLKVGADVTLARTAASTIQLGTATQPGTLSIGSTAQPGTLNIYGQTSTGVRQQIFNGTDTQPRYALTTDGTEHWGPGGATATDTSSARTAPGVLTITNTVNATIGFQVNGAPLAALHLSNGATGSGAIVLANAPAFTGIPTSVTPTAGDNTTKVATTAFVQSAIGGIGGSPVTSVFGRSGAVGAVTGDYTAAQVTNAADKSASGTQLFTGNVGSGAGPTAVGAAAGTTILAGGGVVASKAAGGTILSATVAGDSVYRLTVDTNGLFSWGTGALASDTSLHRSGAGVITVSDTLNALNAFQVNGVPLAASHLSNGVTGSGAVVLANGATISASTVNSSSIQKNGNELVPSGVISAYGGTAAPGGWLLCDGSAVSRTTYASLFSVIGTTYGTGDGSTTFNLPDLRGRVAVGKNTATFSALGASGGEETHLLTTTEMPSHTHIGTTGPEGLTHTHAGNYTAPAAATSQDVALGSTNTVTAVRGGVTASFTTGTESSNHEHSFTSNPTGGSGAHNNLQPYRVINYIIKT